MVSKIFSKYNLTLLLCKKVIFPSLLILCSLAFMKAQDLVNETYESDSFYARGIRYSESAKYEEAIKEFNKIYFLDPNVYKAQYEVNICLSRLDRKEELRQRLDSFLRTKQMEEYPRYYIQYAIFLSENKEYQKSDSIFQLAQPYLSDSYDFLFNYAILLYRKGDKQKTIQYCKKAILLYPQHIGPHYLLSTIAFESGKIFEGTLAAITALCLSPDGYYSNDLIVKLNSNFTQKFLESNNLVFSEKGDEFLEITEILRNGLPLNKKYKLKSKIDDIMPRQVQAIIEYCSQHNGREGFFEHYYVPWIAEIEKRNLTENLSYYLIWGKEKQIGSALTSQKSKITKLQEEYLNTDFWDYFSAREKEVFGTQDKVNVYYENEIRILGHKKNELFNGPCKVLNLEGKIMSDLNFKDGLRDGKQTYYYLDTVGQIKEVSEYKNGVLDGESKLFYKNGKLKSVAHYKDEKYSGKFISYYNNGEIECEFNYVLDEKSGPFVCHFEDGSKKSEGKYVKNYWDGNVKQYNEQNKLNSSTNYIVGKFNGEQLEYYDNGKCKEKYNYKDNKLDGLYQTFFENGEMHYQSKYENDKLQEEKQFNEKGIILEQKNYSSGQLKSVENYSEDGNKISSEKYKDNKLISLLTYSSNSTEGIEQLSKSGELIVKDLEGNILTKGSIKKGLRQGEWIYYYSNGIIKGKSNFKDDVQDGKVQEFEKNGDLEYEYTLKDNKYDGIFTEYKHGFLYRRDNYNNIRNTGPYEYYYPNGKKSKCTYFLPGGQKHKEIDYYQNGDTSAIYYYDDGKLTKSINYAKDNKIDYAIDYSKVTGSYNYSSNGGIYYTNFHSTKTVLKGELIKKDKLGNEVYKCNYNNDNIVGKAYYYSPNNTKYAIYNYENGVLQGEQYYFDYAGKLNLQYQMQLGKSYGNTKRFYPNDSLLSTQYELNDKLYDEKIFYNMSGKPVVAFGFKNNFMVYYRILDATGKLGNIVKVKNGKAEIISNYPNRKRAFNVSINNLLYQGTLEIYEDSGNLSFSCNYKSGELEGNRKVYYPNGKIYKEESFKSGMSQGIDRYYKENGNLWITAESNFDQLHGEFIIYKDGKKEKVYKFDSNDLYEIVE